MHPRQERKIEMKRFFALSISFEKLMILKYIEKLLHSLRAVDRGTKNAYGRPGSLPHRILNTSNGFSITHKNARHLRIRVCNAKCIADLLELFVKYGHIKKFPPLPFITS